MERYWDTRTIYVSIASYCDSECGPTIRDLFRTASFPSRVFVGVVWQGEVGGSWDWEEKVSNNYDNSNRNDASGGVGGGVCFHSANRGNARMTPSSDGSSGNSGGNSSMSGSGSNSDISDGGGDTSQTKASVEALRANVRVVAMPSAQAQGPCWARHIAGSLWRGEDYLLQIDSHMRFRPNWDRYLIWQLEQTREEMVMMQQQQQQQQQPPPPPPPPTTTTTPHPSSQSKQPQPRASPPPPPPPSPATSMFPPKPILTTYPLGYRLPNELPDDIRPTLLVRTNTNHLIR